MVLGRAQQHLQLPVLVPGGPLSQAEAKNEGCLISCSTQSNEQRGELPLAAGHAPAHEHVGAEIENTTSSCTSGRPGPPYGYYHWQHATPLRVRSNWMRLHASTRMHASGAETCTSRRRKLLSNLAAAGAAANNNVPSWERRFWQRDAAAAEKEQTQYLLRQEKKLSMDEAGLYTEEDDEVPDLVNIAGPRLAAHSQSSESLSLQHLQQTSVRAESGGLHLELRSGSSCAEDHEKIIPEEPPAGSDKASSVCGSQDATTSRRVSVASPACAHLKPPAACTHELSIGIGVPSAYRAHATKGAKTPMNSLKTFDFETGDFVNTLSSCNPDRERTSRHKINKVAAPHEYQNNLQEKEPSDTLATPRGAAAGASSSPSSSSSSSSAVPRLLAPATSTCSYNSRSAIRTLPEQLQREKWEQEKLKNREDSFEYDEDSDLLRTCTRDVNLHQVWLRKKRLLIRETHEEALRNWRSYESLLNKAKACDSAGGAGEAAGAEVEGGGQIAGADAAASRGYCNLLATLQQAGYVPVARTPKQHGSFSCIE